MRGRNIENLKCVERENRKQRRVLNDVVIAAEHYHCSGWIIVTAVDDGWIIESTMDLGQDSACRGAD